MRIIPQNQRGDTIVEVLLATSILSIVLATSYGLAIRSFRLLQQSKEYTQATLVTQEQAEAIKAIKDSSQNFAEFSNKFPGLLDGTGSFILKTERGAGNKLYWTVATTSSTSLIQDLINNPTSVLDPASGAQTHPKLSRYYIAVDALKLPTGDSIRFDINVFWQEIGTAQMRRQRLVTVHSDTF